VKEAADKITDQNHNGEPSRSIIQLMTYYGSREIRCSILRSNRNMRYAERMVYQGWYVMKVKGFTKGGLI